MIAQLFIHTSDQGIVHLRWVNCIVCILYLHIAAHTRTHTQTEAQIPIDLLKVHKTASEQNERNIFLDGGS